jgi:DNA recombination protein RmuC
MSVLITAMLFAGVGVAVGRFLLSFSHARRLAVVEERGRGLARRLDEVTAERNTLSAEAAELRTRAAGLEVRLHEARRRSENDRADEERLLALFDRLSRAVLKETTQDLMGAAAGELDQKRLAIEHLVGPVQEHLDKLQEFIQATESQRREEYGGLFQQMQSVAETNLAVQAEAAQLKNVLRSSATTRGRWGEVQLRRVVELAGMREHCDFSEQQTVSGDHGRSRADLVVYLPGALKVPVDAKVPFDAYEQAQRCEDPAVQKQFLMDHAKQFRAHVDTLAKREYGQRYAPSCGFAVLFVPGEALLDAALALDPTLWEQAAERHVLLATPSTLIALLRMAALGWRQEAQAENAAEIARIGKELYKRLVKSSGDLERAGRGLKTAVGAYNDCVGSFEGRVLPHARKLADLSAGDGELKVLDALEESPRELRASEFIQAPAAERISEPESA